jgi:hypothetical protein
MGKGERNRQQNARERIAAQQAAARKAEARRRIFIAGGSVLAVIAIVVVLVVIKTTGKNNNSGTSAAKGPVATASLETQVASDIADVPASALNQAGAGPSGSVTPLSPISKAAPLTVDGKPEMLYIGAEWCPFCGAERWAMAVALSRFGTFSGLHLIHSYSNDIYSNTMTLSFYKSTYTSKYLVFTPVESENTSKGPLQNPTSAQASLMNTYDSPGYFPFIDIANKYTNGETGAQYQPSVLGTTDVVDASHYGLTWQQIASDLSNPSSSVGQVILGTANDLTAAICKVTGGQPGSVCNSAAVKAISQI